MNLHESVVFASPASYAEKAGVAGTCVRKLGIEIPALIDGFDSAIEAAYAAWPDRLYVVGRDGRVAYKSKPGPFGFEPDAVGEVLARLVPEGEGTRSSSAR